jgi:NADPH-dependent ferric siderophore reductase
MSAPERIVRRVRHESRLRMLQVVSTRTITPHMQRITLGGDLDGFTSLGFDDHVKVFFPAPGTAQPILPGAAESPGGAADNAAKPIARDYTPRRYDGAARRLEIEFALHDSGPATAWARQALPGQYVGIGGPRGSFIIPIDFECHLLIGDETALPAIGRRLEELPSGVRAIVIAEVDSIADEQRFVTAARLETMWVHRGGADAGSAAGLLEAARALSLRGANTYAWAAGESAVVKALRRHLVETLELPKDRVKAAGYWKRGAVAVHEKFDD